MYVLIKSFVYRTSHFFIFCLLLASFGIACSARIEPVEGRAKVANGALLVDVRSPEEFAAGHVEGARNIPYDQVERRLVEFGNDTHREIVLYCGSGRRAGLAQETLKAHGFTRSFNAGGYDAWLKAKNRL